MRLKLDTVQGAEIQSSIYSGRIIRMAMITEVDMPLFNADPTVIVRGLATLGMPQKGDKYPAAGYDQWFCKTHIVKAIPGPILLVSIIYEYLGTTELRDSSSMSNIPTQLLPINSTPLYVYWTPPAVAGAGPPKQIVKTVTLNALLPLRHFTISKTIPYQASQTALDAFGTVNKKPWRGLGIGYWLVTALEGFTYDDGITYTYSATFSTKQKEDWSSLGYMEDNNNHAVFIPPAAVAALRNKVYAFGTDNSVDGLVKVGLYALTDYLVVFGI